MAEIKVSQMDFLASVPDDAKIYVVVPGDSTPFYTTKAALLSGLSGQTLQQVTENNNETDRGIVMISEFGDKLLVWNSGDGTFAIHQIIGGSSSPICSITSTGINFQNGIYNLLLQMPAIGNGTYQFPDNTGVELVASQDWASSEINNQILQLIDGAPIDANTLKRLNDKILALQGIISGTNPDGDSIVNTIAELLAVFQNYPEGTDIAQILADKVNVADVVNNLTTVIAGKVLDARQGKALADLIAAKWTAVLANNLQAGIMKLYASPGDNTDGAITQKLFNDTVLSKKGIENANYQILATDKWVHTLGNFSANRTFTLPGDAPQGKEIIVADEQGTVGAFTLTISAPAGKQLNGVTNGTEVIQSAYGWRRFVTDGSGNWFFDAGIVRQQQFNNALASKVNLNSWVDISQTSTITGWSVITIRDIEYLISGNTCQIYGVISGTSNSGEAKFTLPFNYTGVRSLSVLSATITNNGINQTAPGLIRILQNTNEVLFYINGNLGAFQSSNTKQIIFNFSFKIN